MALPVSPLPQTSVSVNGTEVSIRSLSSAAVLQIFEIATADGDSEAFIVAKATGESVEEAAKWLDSVERAVARAFITAILRLSGVIPPEDEGGPKA